MKLYIIIPVVVFVFVSVFVFFTWRWMVKRNGKFALLFKLNCELWENCKRLKVRVKLRTP